MYKKIKFGNNQNKGVDKHVTINSIWNNFISRNNAMLLKIVLKQKLKSYPLRSRYGVDTSSRNLG